MSDRTLLTADEIEALAGELDGWEVRDGRMLYRQFRFKDFARAMGWMMSAAIEADKLDHHPNWTNVYNRVTVELWTHDQDGLTGLDAALARKMSALALAA